MLKSCSPVDALSFGLFVSRSYKKQQVDTPKVKDDSVGFGPCNDVCDLDNCSAHCKLFRK